ncbi:MAG: sulfurtransferase [Gammaproteobacteria bacterium]
MTHPENPVSTALLVSTAWLAEHLDDPGIRTIDTRKGDAYGSAHIRGAVAQGGSPFLRADSDVIGADAFAVLMSQLGVGRDTTVIAYDDGNNLFAARLWWVLKYYGHAQVKVLDGGWDRWVAEGRPVDATLAVSHTAHFETRPDAAWIAGSDYVEASIGRPERVILDVRSDEEWYRTVATGETPVGHVPGAVHLVWSDVLEPDSKRFKSAPELQALFKAAGIRSPHDEVIPYCLGGIRAAHTVLALNIAGYDKVRNYEGSWAAWSREDRPIEPPQPRE